MDDRKALLDAANRLAQMEDANEALALISHLRPIHERFWGIEIGGPGGKGGGLI